MRGVLCPGTPWYKPDFNNFGPRVGFAWAPTRFNDNTLIRAGFGVFFGPGQNDDVFAPIDNAGSRVALERVTVPTLSYPIDPFLPLAATTGVAARAVDENRVDLYANHYSLSIQQVLPGRFVTQIGYVGNQGHHMLDRSYVNLIDPATGRRPLSQFGRVDIKSSGSSTNFNGLQFSLHRPLNNGLLIGTQYMWSHAFDEASLGGGESQTPQNVACRSCEYAEHEPGHPAHIHDELRLRASVRSWQPDSGEGDMLGDVSAGGNVGRHAGAHGRPLTITVSRGTGDLPDGNNAESAARCCPERVGHSLEPDAGPMAEHRRRSPYRREAPGAT